MKVLALVVVALLGVSLVEGRSVRDVKSDLIAKGNRLVKEADAAFQKLTTAQKAAEAATVKSEEAVVKKLIADLEATTATELAQITKIEAELNRAEQRLAAEVAKIEKEVPKPVVTRDLKSDLIAKGQDLIKQADAAVQTLTGGQKLAEAAIVRAEEGAIRRLITELEAATEEPALRRIEAELTRAEARLAAEVAKITKTPVGPAPSGDQKAALIAKGQDLIKQADAAVQALTGVQKVAEAAIVRAEEGAIRRLITELEAATGEAAILRIEGELNRAEQRLAAEVAKITKTPVVVGGPAVDPIRVPVTRDLKSDLIAKGQTLIKEADAAVQALTGVQKVAEAAIVRAEEGAIRRLITELEAATEEPAIRRIEAELTRAEARLAAEVAKITKTPVVVGPVAGDQKAALIAKGQDLIKQADAAVQALTGVQKVTEAAIVRAEEAAIRRLITELEAATGEAAILRIEGELNRAEQRLAAEVAKITKTPVVGPVVDPIRILPVVTRDLKSDLIAKGQDLIKQADAAVQTLTGGQKLAEAAIVRAEEGAIRRLITELEAATEEPAIRRIEAELTRAEARLAAEVAKITKTPVVGPVAGDQKAALIAKGQDLIKQADAAVQALTGVQKVTEAAIVRAEEQAIRRLITELEAATGEAAILRIEGELNRAEQRLAAEVAKITKTPVVPVPVNPVVTRDAKSDLIAKGQALQKQADEAVQKLTGAQKAQEAAIVRTEEVRIKQLIAELETATLPGAVTRIEGELNRAEQKLSFEIQKIEREAKPVTTL